MAVLGCAISGCCWGQHLSGDGVIYIQCCTCHLMFSSNSISIGSKSKQTWAVSRDVFLKHNQANGFLFHLIKSIFKIECHSGSMWLYYMQVFLVGLALKNFHGLHLDAKYWHRGRKCRRLHEITFKGSVFRIKVSFGFSETLFLLHPATELKFWFNNHN